MIQLYKVSNTNFEMNGDYTLNPTSCVFDCTLNDTWSVTITNPIDDSIEDFTVGAVLCVPTPVGDRQLFRIYDADKSDSDVTAIALPVFIDARNDCFLWDVRPTLVKGQEALNTMLAVNSKYSGESDIETVSTAYYQKKNFIEALNGDDENSFINRWGGEIAYDNFRIIVNERQGADNGLRVEFGFNLNSINETINDEEVVTRIIPKAYNGYYLPDNETVDSPLINKYPVIHTRVIEYSNVKLADDVTESDEENSDVIICDTLEDLYEALRQKANEEYENGIDLPSVTYNVDMADLSRTELYKDYKDLLTVNLGDTVHVKHRKLGIETSARVISLSYDCITKKIVSLTLGDYEQNYFNDVSAVTSTVVNVINLENGTLMADKIAGVINLLNTSLRAQRNVADAANEKAILFEDLDEESETYGAMCMGTQGIQIAKERNAANTDWKWGTAINFEAINADYILAGVLQGIDIRGSTFNVYFDTTDGIQNITYLSELSNHENGLVVVCCQTEDLPPNATIQDITDLDIIINQGVYGAGGWEIVWYDPSNTAVSFNSGISLQGGNAWLEVMYGTNTGNLDLRANVTATSFDTSSALELKKDITAFENGLDEIMKTDVYNFKFKDNIDTRNHIGFVIGDGYNVTDKIVNDKSIDIYSALALAYKAIQELNQKVEKLERVIEDFNDQ